MVIYPAEVAAELSMTGRNKNGGVVTRAFLREAIYRNCTGLSRRQADEILEATETGKLSGVSSSSEQWWNWLREPRDRRSRDLWLLSKTRP